MEAKIPFGRDRVLRLMRRAGIEAQRGYGKPKNMYIGKPHTLIPIILDREFEVDHPHQWRVSDITYIKTYEDISFEKLVGLINQDFFLTFFLPASSYRSSPTCLPALIRAACFARIFLSSLDTKPTLNE